MVILLSASLAAAGPKNRVRTLASALLLASSLSVSAWAQLSAPPEIPATAAAPMPAPVFEPPTAPVQLHKRAGKPRPAPRPVARPVLPSEDATSAGDQPEPPLAAAAEGPQTCADPVTAA